MPELDRRSLILGALLSLLFSIPGFSLVGALSGGFVAGLVAGRDGAYHGSLVAVATIAALALLPLPGPTETPAILAFDALLLALGTAGGWAGARLRPSS